jgi:hypothetical protein
VDFLVPAAKKIPKGEAYDIQPFMKRAIAVGSDDNVIVKEGQGIFPVDSSDSIESLRE